MVKIKTKKYINFQTTGITTTKKKVLKKVVTFVITDILKSNIFF